MLKCGLDSEFLDWFFWEQGHFSWNIISLLLFS